MWCSSRINTAVRPRYKTIFRGAIQSISRKNAGAGCWAGRHVFGAHRFSLFEIAHSDTRVLDVSAAGQAGHINCGPCRRIAKFKTPGITLVHDARWYFRSQVRIDEDHIAEFESGCLDDRLQAVEREIDLRGWIIRNLARGWITAAHAGDKKPVVSKYAGRSRIAAIVVRRIDAAPVSKIAHCHGADFNG